MYIVLIPWLCSEIYEPLWLFCLCKYFCNACWFLFRQNRANLNKVHAWNLFLPFFFSGKKKTLDIKKATNTIVILPQERSCSAKIRIFFLKNMNKICQWFRFFSNDTFLNQKSPSLTRDKHKNQPRNSLQSLCKKITLHTLLFPWKQREKCNHIIQEEEKNNRASPKKD